MKKKKADRYRRAQGRKIREEGKREGWREIGKKVKLDRKKHVNEHSTIREAEKLQEA